MGYIYYRTLVSDDLTLLRLLQLADSALPIGGLAHSFGLETLVEGGAITPDSVQDLMQTYLEESLLLETVFCRAAHRAAGDEAIVRELNILLSARKPARETREASLLLGRRFCHLVSACAGREVINAAIHGESHLAVAFGAACRALEIPEESCILAFLEQSCASVLSGLVRLMPLGQVSASIILWKLKAWMADTCRESREWDPRSVPCFNPALEIASMRHPGLETRLFVS